jgi:hypothetical protein
MDANEGVSPAESVMSLEPYQDRSTGLIIFGILTILLGCLCGLFVPLLLVGRLVAQQSSVEQPPLSSVLPAMMVYGILAVALIWLGIGSFMARRWARALLLIFSWSWLVMGVIAFVFMMILLPRTMANIPAGTSGHPAMTADAIGMMMVTMGIIFGVIFVLMPGAWTFFYSSRHVKATCEARDPVARWTDACPLPVLGLSLWLAFSAPMLLITPFAGHGVVPFFGMFLTGLPGGIFCLIIACIWGYAAWALYKLNRPGWWIIFISMCAMMLSTVLTFSTHNLVEMYHLMGFPESQIEQMEKTGLLAGNGFIWLSAIWMVPFLGYLVYVRKYIFRKS